MKAIHQGRHKVTGKMYDVLCVANDDATREGWPTTVVYRDDKSVWALPVDRWLEKFDLVKI